MLAQPSLHHVGLSRSWFTLAHPEAWVVALVTQVHRAWCALRGHDLRLHFGPRRISLTCADCGWESPGWIVAPSTCGSSRARSVARELDRHGIKMRGIWRRT